MAISHNLVMNLSAFFLKENAEIQKAQLEMTNFVSKSWHCCYSKHGDQHNSDQFRNKSAINTADGHCPSSPHTASGSQKTPWISWT